MTGPSYLMLSACTWWSRYLATELPPLVPLSPGSTAFTVLLVRRDTVQDVRFAPPRPFENSKFGERF